MKQSVTTVEELMTAGYENYEQMYRAIQRYASQSVSDHERLTVYLNEHAADPAADQAVKLALAAHFLERPDLVIQILKAGPEGREKRWLLAIAYKEQKEYTKALADLERARARGWDEAQILAETVENHRRMGDVKTAHHDLGQLKKTASDSALYYYQAAGLAEAEGDIEQALDHLQAAADRNPDFLPAVFRLAFLTDLNGDEDRALELYKLCRRINPVHVNALINLAVLYEDSGRYEQAETLLEQVVAVHPNHPRARLFLKDVQSSLYMFFDEESERKRDKFQQVLDMPISDFELSVRSRNCLKKMGIKTLGDLTRITEAELLSYKNFGETSLNEIKAIMTTKGLRLGQAVEDKAAKKAAALLPGSGPEAPAGIDQALLAKTIDDLQFSVRSRKCLLKLNVNTVADLVNYSEAQLMSVKNFGSVSLKEVKEKLAGLGLGLRDQEA